MIKKILVTSLIFVTATELFGSCCEKNKKSKKDTTQTKSVAAKRPAISERVENLENRVDILEDRVDNIVTTTAMPKSLKGEKNEED